MHNLVQVWRQYFVLNYLIMTVIRNINRKLSLVNLQITDYKHDECYFEPIRF